MFSWSKVTNATGYLLKVRNISNNNIVINKNLSSSSYTSTISLPVANYTWTVQAYNDAGTGPISNALVFIIEAHNNCDIIVNTGESINQAIKNLGKNSSLSKIKPGVVCLSTGVHLLSVNDSEASLGIRLRSNLILKGIGQNPNDTIITIPNNFNRRVFWGSYYWDSVPNLDSNIKNIRLENFTIDGNGDNQLPSYCRDGSDLSGSILLEDCNIRTTAISVKGVDNITIDYVEFINISGYCVKFNDVLNGIVRNSKFKNCGRKEYLTRGDGLNGRQQKDALYYKTRGGGIFEDNFSEYTDEYTNRRPYGNGGVGCYSKINNTAPLRVSRNTFINVSTGSLGSDNCNNVIFEDNNLIQVPSNTGFTGGEFAFDVVNFSENITINNNIVENYDWGVGVIAKSSKPGAGCVKNINVTNNIFKVPFHDRGFLLCKGGNSTRGFLILDGHIQKTSINSTGDFYFYNNTILPTDEGSDISSHPDWCYWDRKSSCN